MNKEKEDLFLVTQRMEFQISKTKGLGLLRKKICSQQLINFLSAA